MVLILRNSINLNCTPRLEVIGLSYLLSLDVSFGVWFFAFLALLQTGIQRMLGWSIGPPQPFFRSGPTQRGPSGPGRSLFSGGGQLLEQPCTHRGRHPQSLSRCPRSRRQRGIALLPHRCLRCHRRLFALPVLALRDRHESVDQLRLPALGADHLRRSGAHRLADRTGLRPGHGLHPGVHRQCAGHLPGRACQPHRTGSQLRLVGRCAHLCHGLGGYRTEAGRSHFAWSIGGCSGPSSPPSWSP